jgi:N,N'-diacetylchitobiose transport system permease protein
MTATITTPPGRTGAPLSPARDRRMAYLLVLPAVAITLIAIGYPLVRQIIMSFQKFGLEQQFGQAPSFVGVTNYGQVLSDPDFWAAFVRSLVFCVIVAALTMVIGVAGALLLTKTPRPIAVGVQIVMLVAWAMPVMSSLQVFQLMFSSRSGVVDWALSSVGLSQFNNFNWLANPFSFFVVAGLLVVWMSVPLVVFMAYAALTQIDDSVLEAAQLDGAASFGMFRHILLPSIAPVLSLVTMLELIWDIRVFTQVHVLQANSGITQQTHVLGTYIFQTGLSGGNYGLASAAAMIMLLLSILLTAYYLRNLLKGSAL